MMQGWADYWVGLRSVPDELTSTALYLTVRVGSSGSRTDRCQNAAAQRPGNQRDAVTAGFEGNRRLALAGSGAGSLPGYLTGLVTLDSTNAAS